MRCAATRAARAPNYRCACASGDLRRGGSCSTLGVQDLCRSTARFSDVEPLLPGPGADAAGVFGVFAREGVRVGDTADRVAVRMDCESERCGCTGLVEGGEDVVEDDAGSKSRIRVRPCGRHSVVNLGRALRHRAAASAGLAVRSSAMTALVRCAKTGAARRRIRTAGRTLCRLRAWGVRPTL